MTLVQLLLFGLVGTGMAAPQGEGGVVVEERIVSCLGLMLVGTVLMFLGKHARQLVQCVSGVVLCGWLVYFTACVLWPDGEELGAGVYVAATISALVGGLLSVFSRPLGGVMAGGLLGAELTMLLVRAAILKQHENQALVCIMLVATTALMAYLFEAAFVVLSSSVTGAVLFMLGVETLAGTGFGDFVTEIRTTPAFPAPGLKVWAMLLSVCLLAALAMLVQFKSPSEPHKPKPKPLAES